MIAEMRSGKRRAMRSPRGRTVIKDINRELLQTDLLDEISHHFGHVFKGVLENIVAGGIGKAKARQVRRNDMVVVGQLRNEITEYVAGGWKAMQQQHGRLLWIACFPVENLETIDRPGFEETVGCVHSLNSMGSRTRSRSRSETSPTTSIREQ